MSRVTSGRLLVLIGGVLFGGSVGWTMQPPAIKTPPSSANKADTPPVDRTQLEELKTLARKLSSDDEAERIDAIKQLVQMGPKALPALRPIARAVQDKSAMVRAHALVALSNFGEAARPAAPMIAKAVVDEDRRVRRAALMALRKIKPDRNITLPIVASALANADPATRSHALHSIAEMGETAMPALLRALEHPQGKYWALLVLSEMGDKGKEAVPAVTKLLGDESLHVRREAAMTLGMMGEAAKPSVPAIVKLLDDGDVPVQYAAAFALGALGPNAAAAVSALEAKLAGDDPQMQVTAAWALAKIKANDSASHAKSLSIIVKGLTSDNRMVRMASMRALRDLKPDPKKVFPAVRAALEKDPKMIHEMLDVLQESGDASMPLLVYALEKPESRGQAAYLLGRLGKHAAGAVKALTQALDEDDIDVLREVIFALGAIGPEASSAVPALVKLLDSDYERVRHAATFALGKIGPAAKPAAVGRLQKELANDDVFEQRVAAWALAHIDPTNAAVVKDAVPVLIGSLASDDPVVRAAGATALGKFGKGATSATQALSKVAAEDEDEQVRAAAAEALEKIKD